uniref:Uncharacterized protein n=1 Tax=Zea mays TaxID=4577 RepID=C0P761_MAIZE|nr:unknown [Zea mays]
MPRNRIRRAPSHRIIPLRASSPRTSHRRLPVSLTAAPPPTGSGRGGCYRASSRRRWSRRSRWRSPPTSSPRATRQRYRFASALDSDVTPRSCVSRSNQLALMPWSWATHRAGRELRVVLAGLRAGARG